MTLPDLHGAGAWAILAASGGIIATCWRQMLSVWQYLRGMLFGSLSISCYSNLAYGILMYVQAEKKYYRLGTPVEYCSMGWFIKQVKRAKEVIYEPHYSRPFLVILKGWPLLIWGNQSKNQNGAPGSSDRTLRLLYIRRTIDIEKFLLNSIEFLDARQNGDDKTAPRFRIQHCLGEPIGSRMGGQSMLRAQTAENPVSGSNKSGPEPTPPFANISLYSNRLLGYAIEELLPERTKEAMEDLALSPEVEEVLQEIFYWRASEEWFRERRVPWKMGVLAAGKPGNGKTSLFRAIAQKLDFPMFVVNLPGFDNVELRELWTKILQNAPCMVVFEDFDTVFEGRVNKTATEQNIGVTFDCLLNCIDGLEKSDGVLLGISTNLIDTIDPALGRPVAPGSRMSTRPGRIDRIIHMEGPDAAGRRKIAERILSGCAQSDDLDQIVKEGEGDSGTQFQSRCQDYAFKHFWKKAQQATKL